MIGRLRAKFLTTASKISESLNSPFHHSSFLVSEHIVEILSYPKSVILNRPIAPGFV